MKIIEFFGNTYLLLTEKPFWADCDIDILDRATGEWSAVCANDIVWLYDAAWPANAYDGLMDCRDKVAA